MLERSPLTLLQSVPDFVAQFASHSDDASIDRLLAHLLKFPMRDRTSKWVCITSPPRARHVIQFDVT